MFDIIIQGIIIAIGTTLIAIRTKEPSQKLKTYTFLFIGVLLTLCGYVYEKNSAKKERKLIAEQIININTQLSSIEDLCDKKAINQMRVDVDSWASNLSANLEIREIKELKEKAIKTENKLKKRMPATSYFNNFIASIKNFIIANNKQNTKKLVFQLPDVTGSEKSDIGIIRGDINTCLLTFSFNDEKFSSNKPELKVQRISNVKFDERVGSIDSTDIETVINNKFLLDLELIQNGWVSFYFDEDNNIIKVSEFDIKNWGSKNKIFEESYEISVNIYDSLGGKLISDVIYSERFKDEK